MKSEVNMATWSRSHASLVRRLVAGIAGATILAAAVLASGDPPKAVVEPKSVSAAADMERLIDLDADRDAPADTPWFLVEKGDFPVLISAPHATKVFRENAWRFADGGGTAALAVQLHELNRVTVIHTVFRAPSDPNYYDDNDYKKTLGTLLQQTGAKLVLDIHGSDSRRPYDVDIGTLDGKSLMGHQTIQDDLVRTFRAHGIEAISSNFFAASKNHTVTRYCTEHGVVAMQLEINASWLDPAGGDLAAHRFAALLDALTDFLRSEAFVGSR
jgi:hypothetical protein